MSHFYAFSMILYHKKESWGPCPSLRWISAPLPLPPPQKKNILEFCFDLCISSKKMAIADPRFVTNRSLVKGYLDKTLLVKIIKQLKQFKMCVFTPILPWLRKNAVWASECNQIAPNKNENIFTYYYGRLWASFKKKKKITLFRSYCK